MTHNRESTGRTILVVEDEAVIAMDLCDMLKDLGYSPLGPAKTVKRALGLLEEQEVDAALLDENLAGTAVTPVAEALMKRGVPFVIVSGHVRSSSDHQSLRDAPRIAKPTTAASITEALARFW